MVILTGAKIALNKKKKNYDIFEFNQFIRSDRYLLQIAQTRTELTSIIVSIYFSIHV